MAFLAFLLMAGCVLGAPQEFQHRRPFTSHSQREVKSSNIFSPDGFKDLQSLLYNHRENLRHKTKEVKILSEGQSFSNYILPKHFRHPPVEPSSSSRRPAFYKDTAIPAEVQTERYLTVIDTPQPSQFSKRSSRLPITDLWTGEQFFTTPYSQYSTPTTTPSTSNTGPPIKMWINNQPVAYSPDELKQNQQSHHHTYDNTDRHYYEYPQYEEEILESYFPNEDAPLTGHNERDDWTSYPHHEFEYDGDQQYPLYEYFIIHEFVEETEEKPTAKPYQSEHIYNTARPSFADKINYNQPSKQILVPLDIEDQKVLVPYSITTESSLNSYKFLPPSQVSPSTPPVRSVDPSTRPSVQQLFRGDNHKFQPEGQETKSNDVPLVHFFVNGDKEDQIEQSSPITVTQSSSGQTTSDPKIQITTNNVNPETLTNILSSIQEHLNDDSEASMNTTPASESSGVELVSNIEKPESIQAVQHSNNEGSQSSSAQNSNIQDSNIETPESALVAQDLDEPDIGTTTSSTPDLNSVSMSSEIDQALLNLLGLSVGNAQSDLSNLDLNEFSTLLGLSNTDLQASLSGDEMNMLSDMLSFIDSDSLGSENPSATSNNFNSKPRLPPYVISMLQGGQNAPPGTTGGQLVNGIPKAMIDSELPKVNKNTNEKNKNTDSLNKEQLGLLLDGNSAVKDMKRRPNLVATLNFLANNRARNEDIAASYGIPESLVELAQREPNSRRGNEQTSLEKETPKESSSLLFGSLPSMVANFLGFTDEPKAEDLTSSFTSRSLDVGSSYPTLQSLFGRTTAKYFKKSSATPILTSTIGAETPISTSGYSQAIEKTVEGHRYAVDEETSDSKDITKNFEGSTIYSHFQASQIFDQSKDSSHETTPSSLNEEVSFQERDDLFGHSPSDVNDKQMESDTFNLARETTMQSAVAAKSNQKGDSGVATDSSQQHHFADDHEKTPFHAEFSSREATESPVTTTASGNQVTTARLLSTMKMLLDSSTSLPSSSPAPSSHNPAKRPSVSVALDSFSDSVSPPSLLASLNILRRNAHSGHHHSPQALALTRSICQGASNTEAPASSSIEFIVQKCALLKISGLLRD